ALADPRTSHLCGLHPAWQFRAGLEADGREHLAPPDRTVDGHREIGLPLRRSGLGRQVHVRRIALATLSPEKVSSSFTLLAVRRLGSSSWQVGRRGGLPGTMSGCPVVRVFEAGHCIRLFEVAFLPLDNVELDFVTFFYRFVPVRLNR